jgi:hypothetical protein
MTEANSAGCYALKGFYRESVNQARKDARKTERGIRC